MQIEVEMHSGTAISSPLFQTEGRRWKSLYPAPRELEWELIMFQRRDLEEARAEWLSNRA